MQEYPAREEFKRHQVADIYDAVRHAGLINRMVWRAETKAIARAALELPGRYHVLDIPCGTARLWDPLIGHFAKVVGVDISDAMLGHAVTRYDVHATTSFTIGDATSLPFTDQQFDCAFSVRFFGHLPWDVSLQVLREFNRVCRHGVVVMMYMWSPVYALREWYRRHYRPVGYPWYTLTRPQLRELFRQAGLRIVWKRSLLPLVSQGLLVRAVPA